MLLSITLLKYVWLHVLVESHLHLFQLILFNIVPTFIDIIVALVLFCIIFDWQLAMVVFLVMFAYGQQSSTLSSNVYLIDFSCCQCRSNQI